MGHHGVADDPGHQAAEPVPRRMGHHHPALPTTSRFGQFLREPGERHAVHGEPSSGIGGGLDPAAVRPAAHGIGTDPQEARRLLDPEGGHPATLTQMRLRAPIPGASARASAPSGRVSATGFGATLQPAIAAAALPPAADSLTSSGGPDRLVSA